MIAEAEVIPASEAVAALSPTEAAELLQKLQELGRWHSSRESDTGGTLPQGGNVPSLPTSLNFNYDVFDNLRALASPEKAEVFQQTWAFLAEAPEDAAELAALLLEAAPRLGLVAALTPKASRGLTSRRSADVAERLRQRLATAEPLPTGPGEVPWQQLSTVCSSEALKFAEDSDSSTGNCDLVEVNSGGVVFFCFFTPASAPRQQSQQRQQRRVVHPHEDEQRDDGNGLSTSQGAGGQQESCLVLKFLATRLLTQSEQFANELSRHLGICAPASRILRQHGPHEAEWHQACRAASLADGGQGLVEQMEACSCALVLEFVPSSPFLTEAVFQPYHLLQTCEDLGRLFLLDMVLGNPDRLPCEALGWRGNHANLLHCTAGRMAGRVVAIDACVQRRPPGALTSQEDSACHGLTELMLNDEQVAGTTLQEAVAGQASAAGAVVAEPQAAAAFQRGLRLALMAMMAVKGLLEMMHVHLADLTADFIEDMEAVEERAGTAASSSTPGHSAGPEGRARRLSSNTPLPDQSTTLKIRTLQREGQKNDLISAALAKWRTELRSQGAALRQGVESWQRERAAPGAAAQQPLLTTGFLDGSHPIVDAYELKVRLEHMLSRLRVLQDAAATGVPTLVAPRLYLSGAVEANSLHVLRRLGITHLLNATEDLLAPDPSQGFEFLRCALRDAEDECISGHLRAATAFISASMAGSGSILVHCHEGKSRSVAIVLAFLMESKGWTLRRALAFVTTVRPSASPNAGFMAQLLELDERLNGTKTVKVKRSKPEPCVCPICHDSVGVSMPSLMVHMKKQHPAEFASTHKSGVL